MDLNDTSNDSNSSSDVSGETGNSVIPPSSVQFWTFLVFEIPSLACTIFLLTHLLLNRKLREALHNHVIIIFLLLTFFIEVLDDPLYIDAYRFGGNANSFPMSVPVCLMWWFIDYGFYGAITVFLAWASIERHILVFHHQLVRTRRQQFFIHYLPLIIISIYIFGFYIGVIFFPPCENTFDFESLACGLSPCYGNIPFLNTWDYLGNGIVCTFIETISSIALIIRVIWQKRRTRQRVDWRKHRKMAFQILSISCLSLTIVFPQSLITVIQQVGGPQLSNFGDGVNPYLFYLYTFVVYLLPFICLCSLPELWKKLWIFRRKRQGIVGPMTLMVGNVQSIALRPRAKTHTAKEHAAKERTEKI
jgi:hypothetical protein